MWRWWERSYPEQFTKHWDEGQRLWDLAEVLAFEPPPMGRRPDTERADG